MPKIPTPTESELNILQVLWEYGPSSVRFVNDKLSEQKDVGYTTTLKLMQIMVEKGILTRNTESRSHIYTSRIAEQDTKGHLLNNFLKSTFQGSASNLIMQALGNHNTSAEELEEIKKLIKELENTNHASN